MGFLLKDCLHQRGGGAFDLQDVVLAGMYPETIQRPAGKRRDAWFSAYITALLQRDVRDLANIDGLIEMPRLLSLLAARVVCAASPTCGYLPLFRSRLKTTPS